MNPSMYRTVGLQAEFIQFTRVQEIRNRANFSQAPVKRTKANDLIIAVSITVPPAD